MPAVWLWLEPGFFELMTQGVPLPLEFKEARWRHCRAHRWGWHHAAGWLWPPSVGSIDNRGCFYLADSRRQHACSQAWSSDCLVASRGRGWGRRVLFDVPFSCFTQLSRPAARLGAGMEQPGNTVCLRWCLAIDVTDVCPTTVPRTISEVPQLSLTL